MVANVRVVFVALVVLALPASAYAGRWSESNRVAHWVDSLQWPDAEVREISARALGAVGDPHAVSPLIDALEDESGHVRVAAAWALGELGHPRASKHLNHIAGTDPYSPARASALRALSKIDHTDPDTIASLRLGLRDRNAFVRATAAEGFAFVAGESAYPDIVKLLDDEDWSVRLAATIGIGQMQTMAGADPLSGVLLKDEHEYVRTGAANALGRIGGNTAVAALKKAVASDPSARVHLEALRALVELRVPIGSDLGTEPTYESEVVPRSPGVQGARRTIDL